MNLSINSVTPNYNAKNCQRKNNPNFGMAIKFTESGMKEVKRQAMKLSDVAKDGYGNASPYAQYWQTIKNAIREEAQNLENIIVDKKFGMHRLTATVVDADAETAVKNTKFSQGLFRKNGDLKFLDESRAGVRKLHDSNANIEEFEIAEKADFKPGRVLEETEAAE